MVTFSSGKSREHGRASDMLIAVDYESGSCWMKTVSESRGDKINGSFSKRVLYSLSVLVLVGWFF
jgi:hypothetical protein